jgi:hypothetical protein
VAILLASGRRLGPRVPAVFAVRDRQDPAPTGGPQLALAESMLKLSPFIAGTLLLGLVNGSTADAGIHNMVVRARANRGRRHAPIESINAGLRRLVAATRPLKQDPNFKAARHAMSRKMTRERQLRGLTETASLINRLEPRLGEEHLVLLEHIPISLRFGDKGALALDRHGQLMILVDHAGSGESEERYLSGWPAEEDRSFSLPPEKLDAALEKASARIAAAVKKAGGTTPSVLSEIAVVYSPGR